MADTVRIVVAQVEHLQISKQGCLQQERQRRLGEVISKLLAFWPEQRVVDWLMKKNAGLGNIPPVDLIESEYATTKLFSFIGEMKQRCAHEKKRKVPHTPLREKLRGYMTDPGPPQEFIDG